MKDRDAGRVALVTGAAGDIGWEIAQALEAAGLHLVLADRDRDALLARNGGEPRQNGRVLLGADLGRPAECLKLVADAVAVHGRLDVLVNNAAIVTPSHRIAELSLSDWQQAFDVNLTAAFLLCREALPHLLRRRGLVLNIASQLGHVAAPGRSAYSATKAGLLALTRSLAAEYGEQGLRAVSLSPGSIATSRLTGRYGSVEAAEAALAPRHPAGRIGRPRDVAEMAAFLAAGGSEFMLGSDILIDGGYTAI